MAATAKPLSEFDSRPDARLIVAESRPHQNMTQVMTLVLLEVRSCPPLASKVKGHTKHHVSV